MAIMYSIIGWHVFFAMYLAGKVENPRLFVRHTRMCAGSGHSVKAKPCRAASRALTGCPCFPAMDTCGRRTRKPPAGARSKEVRSSKIQRQQHKKAFFASRGFPAYRHAADMMHTSLPRLTLHRIFPIHTALPHTRRSDARAVMRVMTTLPCVGY